METLAQARDFGGGGGGGDSSTTAPTWEDVADAIEEAGATAPDPDPADAGADPAEAAKPAADGVSAATAVVPASVVAQDHPLHAPWTMYYHSPEDSSWAMSSYKRVHTFATIEDYARFYRDLPAHSFHLGMWFLMVRRVKPTWEDPANRRGGCWSYKVAVAEVFPLWCALTTHLVNETLSTVPGLLNGISLSPKKGFCILKIWNTDSARRDTRLLHQGIPALGHAASLYTAFKEK